VRRLFALLFPLTFACRAAPIPEAGRFPAGTQFTARFREIEGRRIRYIDAGRGTTVIFIHGLGASMYAWRKNLAPVLAAGFRVVTFDNLGFGSSDKPAHGYTNAEYAHLLVALMDSLHVSDAALVGHSMGGAIAAEAAIRSPERIGGLVLIDAAGVGTREPMLFSVARWPVIGPGLLSLRGRGLVERLLKATYADPTKVSEADVDQYYAPVADRDYGRALRGVLREFRFDALDGRLGAIAAPTLVLWGEQDRVIPIAAGRAMAAELPRSAFLSVRHAGHSVQEETPEEVNRLVIKFLKEGLPRVPENLARPASANAAIAVGHGTRARASRLPRLARSWQRH
jgi:pimeloyl-ACP methyl ester carboxylesterase